MLKRVRVRGHSMLPSHREGDRLLVLTWTYRVRAPRRGEVVLVDHPSGAFRTVKRVTAVPGDAFEGRVLGPDEYAVRGDNGAASTDSTTYGPVPRSRFRGRVWLGYRPLRRVR